MSVLAFVRGQPLLFVGSSKAYSVLSARVVVARRARGEARGEAQHFVVARRFLVESAKLWS